MRFFFDKVVAHMTDQSSTRVTQILVDLGEGDPHAAAKLLPLVYEELRRLAHDRMRHEPAGLTLQPTALVHEAYLRLVGNETIHWDSRGHFFSAAAEAMRRILVERARKVGRIRHGGGRQRDELEKVEPAQTGDGLNGDDILALDNALQRLEREDPTRSRVVKLRYFAGLSIEQTADVLGISAATVSRHWTFARAWLCREMTRDGPASRPGER